jgi:hypothetical protein
MNVSAVTVTFLPSTIIVSLAVLVPMELERTSLEATDFEVSTAVHLRLVFKSIRICFWQPGKAC